jgi:hypothetical protein
MTWRGHVVSAFDSPFVDPSRIAEARTMYGEEAPEWYSEILGRIAPRQRTTLVAMHDYHRALRRSPLFTGDRGQEMVLPYEHPAPDDLELVRRKRAGEPAEQLRNVIALDPSAGGDLCLAARRKGSALVELCELDGRSEDAMAHGLIAMMRAARADEIVVERGGGYGRGAVEIVRREFKGVVRWWDPSGRPREHTCANVRAEAWLNFGHLLAGSHISLIPDRAGRLEAALAAIGRRSTESGKTLITPKEKLIDELGFSPDAADATVICFSGYRPGTGDSSSVVSTRFSI